ncbi:MAG: polyphosphate polymerase domain-containing protein [Planctomycetaceae bacterium]
MKTSATHSTSTSVAASTDTSSKPVGSEMLSPSLLPGRTASNVAAYELKCVISEDTAGRLGQLFSGALLPDPYAMAGENGYYSITTLSTDTPEWNCFYRVSGFAKRKYRIRRYGAESIVYLERKTRRGSRVCKQRNAVHLNDLNRLDLFLPSRLRDDSTHCEVCSEESSGGGGWNGHQFHSEVSARRLSPVCLMTYHRQAWFGHSENGTIRWTLDRHLRGCKKDNWSLDTNAELQPVIGEGQVICEFKFRGSMPQIFKAAVAELHLEPGGFSKFRHCVSALYGLSNSSTENISTQTSELADEVGRENRNA